MLPEIIADYDAASLRGASGGAEARGAAELVIDHSACDPRRASGAVGAVGAA